MLFGRDPAYFAIPPGTLRLTRASPNPNGMGHAQLFLLVGDATAEPVHTVVPDEDIDPAVLAPVQRTRAFRLKVLHFNDLHGHLVHFSRPDAQPVFSRMVHHVHRLRTQYRDHPDRAVLALSAGDDSVGSVFDELLGRDTSSFQAHAAYRLYSAAGVDACTIGNHDLDLGARLLAHAVVHDAAFPVLSANLAGCSWLSGLHFPGCLFVVKGIRIGVIGLTTPGQIAPQPDSTLRLEDPVRVAQNLLPALKPLCDVTIILSHLGYSLDATSATVLQAGDVELARQLPHGSAHVIIGGHTHHALNEQGLSAHNIVNGIPIVQAGALGRFLGEADITIGGSAAVTSVRLLPTADLPVDYEFEEQHVQPFVARVRPILARPLGTVDDNADLSTDAIWNDFAAGESALANFIADALAERCRRAGYGVDFALIDASSICCGIPPGRLTLGDWFGVMPFADTVRICTMDGETLHDYLDDNAQRSDRPDEAHMERGFVQFSREVRYEIQLGKDRLHAGAHAIFVGGRPLEDQADCRFTVACTSFLRVTAAGWEAYARHALGLARLDGRDAGSGGMTEDTRLFLRNELIAYIGEHGGVTAAGGAQRDGRLVIVS